MLSLVPLLARSPLQAFARLHALAGKGTVSDEQLGRPRDGEAAERLRALSTTLLAPPDAPPTLVAALVHRDLLTAAPFASHHGLVARADALAVLSARDVVAERQDEAAG